MTAENVYDNPLVTRYASREIAQLFGPQRKFSTWRRLWLALAEAQQRLVAQHEAHAQAAAERRAKHEQTLLDLHLRHERLLSDQMVQLDQWRVEQASLDAQHARQSEQRLAAFIGTSQLAAAAAGPDQAEAALRMMQALAEHTQE